MKKKSTHFLVEGAIIAGIYAALTYVAATIGLAYGPLQFRFSEALTILAAFTPAAIPGLTIGCFLGNLGSPYGLVDIFCGTAATLLAATASYYLRTIKIKEIPFLALLSPVLFNAIIVGAEITFFTPNAVFLPVFSANAAWVGLGEFIICFGLGIPLYLAVKKTKIFKNI